MIKSNEKLIAVTAQKVNSVKFIAFLTPKSSKPELPLEEVTSCRSNILQDCTVLLKNTTQQNKIKKFKFKQHAVKLIQIHALNCAKIYRFPKKVILRLLKRLKRQK